MRLEAALNFVMVQPRAAADALGPSGVRMLQGMRTLVASSLSEDEYMVLTPLILQVWFGLVPAGACPDLRFGEMTAAFRIELQRIEQSRPLSADEPHDLFEDVRQPALLEAMIQTVLEMAKTERMPPRLDSFPVIVAALKVLVNELDCALR